MTTSTEADPGISTEIVVAANSLLTKMLARPEVLRDAHIGGWSSSLWAAITDAGWFDLLLADESGGMGFDLDVIGPLLAEAGRHLVPGPLIEHVVVVPLLSNATSSSELQRDLGLVALVDCSAGMQDRRERPRLDGGVLTGQCGLVRFGSEAANFVVIADGYSCTSVLLVSAAAAGVRTAAVPSLDPTAHHAQVCFDQVSDYVVLAEGADSLIAEIRSAVRLMTAFELSGLTRRLLDDTVAFAQDRHQFGRAIGSFQSVQHLLADMCAQTLALEALCDQVATMGWTRPEWTSLQSKVAKAAASAAARTVGEGALQVHGGIAFTAEHHIHRWLLHALTLQGLYGDETQLALEVGRHLLTTSEDPWA